MFGATSVCQPLGVSMSMLIHSLATVSHGVKTEKQLESKYGIEKTYFSLGLLFSTFFPHFLTISSVALSYLNSLATLGFLLSHCFLSNEHLI